MNEYKESFDKWMNIKNHLTNEWIIEIYIYMKVNWIMLSSNFFEIKYFGEFK